MRHYFQILADTAVATLLIGTMVVRFSPVGDAPWFLRLIVIAPIVLWFLQNPSED